MSLCLTLADGHLQNETEYEVVAGKQNQGVNQAPDPACCGAHVALLKIALNHLKNKGSAADKIAQKKASGKVLRQVGIVAGFYLDSNLKGC